MLQLCDKKKKMFTKRQINSYSGSHPLEWQVQSCVCFHNFGTLKFITKFSKCKPNFSTASLVSFHFVKVAKTEMEAIISPHEKMVLGLILRLDLSVANGNHILGKFYENCIIRGWNNSFPSETLTYLFLTSRLFCLCEFSPRRLKMSVFKPKA